MPSLPRRLGLVPAIFNKVWTMNSIAFCYLHSCYHCVLRRMTGATAEDKLAFKALGRRLRGAPRVRSGKHYGRASSTRSMASFYMSRRPTRRWWRSRSYCDTCAASRGSRAMGGITDKVVPEWCLC